MKKKCNSSNTVILALLHRNDITIEANQVDNSETPYFLHSPEQWAELKHGEIPSKLRTLIKCDPK